MTTAEAAGSISAPEPVVEGADASPPAAETPSPAARRITAADRLKIIGLSRNAAEALRESRLMTPPGDNAFTLYQQILKIDPDHADAKRGLRNVASRYVAMAGRAIDGGDLDRARTYVDRAKKADESYAGIRAIEERLGR